MKKTLLTICVGLFVSGAAWSQQAASANTGADADISESGDFDRFISLGYRPKAGRSLLDLSYLNYKASSSAKLSSSTVAGSVKFVDVDQAASYVDSVYRYGINDKINLGFEITNYFDGSNSYKYSNDAKSLGFADFSSNRKGNSDPVLFVDSILKESNNFRLVGKLSFSPSIGTRSDSNRLRGGSEMGADIDVTKSNGKFEFAGGIGYRSYSERSEDDGDNSSNTSGGNLMAVRLSANLFVSDNSSIAVKITKSQLESSTLKYKSNGSKVETDGYGSTGYLIGFQNQMSDDFAFLAGFYGESVDGSVSKIGTIKLTGESANATGFGVSFKIGF
jgi:hypothetical protein